VDDLLVEEGRIAPFSPTETSYAAMGRYGKVFLTSGDPELRLGARAGEVVRLWLTNTANTRVFSLRLPGARMKLVGGDSGRVEHQELVDQAGELALEHHTPDRTYRLATITVDEGQPTRPPKRSSSRAELPSWRPSASSWSGG
jgi:FtsP/CotA-like multicopper oxidase with cupredoxin domain